MGALGRVACLALVAWLVLGLSARAQALALSFRAPPGCGTGDELSVRVQRIAGVESSAAQITVEMASGADGSFTLRVDIDGNVRELADRDCRALFESAALMIALRINPALSAVPAEPLPAAPRAPAAPTPSAPRVERPRLDVQSVRRARPVRSIWLEAGVVRGLVPDLNAALALGGELGGPWLRAMASFGYVAPRATEDIAVQAARGRLSLAATPTPQLWLGVGLEGDVLFGRGRNVEQTRADRVTRGAAVGELGVVVFGAGAQRLALVGEVSAALHRGAFRVARVNVDNSVEYRRVYRPEPWALAASLRWQLHFPR